MRSFDHVGKIAVVVLDEELVLEGFTNDDYRPLAAREKKK